MQLVHMRTKSLITYWYQSVESVDSTNDGKQKFGLFQYWWSIECELSHDGSKRWTIIELWWSRLGWITYAQELIGCETLVLQIKRVI